jgi:hypothetical protein
MKMQRPLPWHVTSAVGMAMKTGIVSPLLLLTDKQKLLHTRRHLRDLSTAVSVFFTRNYNPQIPVEGAALEQANEHAKTFGLGQVRRARKA